MRKEGYYLTMESAAKYLFDKPTLLIGFTAGFIFIGFLDPINWPKQVMLLSVLPYLIAQTRLVNRVLFPRMQFVLIGLTVSLILALTSATLSTLFEDVDETRTIWGLWGRNNGILTLLALLLVAWTFSVYVQKEKFLRKFFHSIEISSAIYCSYAFLQFFGVDPVNWSKSNEVFSFFGNTNFAAAVFALSSSTFLILAVFESKRKLLLVLRVSFFFVAAFLAFQTGSVQGLAGLLIVSLLVIFILIKANRRLATLGIFSSVSLIGIIVFLGTAGIGPLAQYIEQYTVQLRVQYWLTGIRIGNSSPIWGVGVDSYGDYFRTFRSQELAERTSIDLITNNAHNVFIQYYATMGVLGLLSVLIPAAFAGIYSFKLIFDKDKSGSIRALGALFLALWSMAFFSIDNISIAVWNWAVLGAVIGVWVSERPGALGQNNAQKQRSMPHKDAVDLNKGVALLVSGAMFAISWFSSYPDRSMQKFLAIPINPNVSNERIIRLEEVNRVASSPFVMETEYWYLANELNKIGANPESLLLLDSALVRYPRDFNLIDLSAAYREQMGMKSEAIPFRELQLEIEPRHPRIWLSYGFNLLESGQLTKAQDAFRKVIENRVFLSQEILDQLPEIAKQFQLEYTG